MSWSDIVTRHGKAEVVTEAIFGGIGAPYIRAAVRGDVIAAVAQAGHGTCQVVDTLGHHWDSGEVAAGQYCVGIRVVPEGWEVTWMRAPFGATFGRTVLGQDLQPLSPNFQNLPTYPATGDGTSQGFLDVIEKGTLLMTDQNRSVVLGPLTIGLPTTRGHWTIGQDWTGGARVVAWHSGRQQAYEVWRGDSPVASHLTLEADGTAAVCPGFTDLLIREEQFTPWVLWPSDPVPEPKPEPEPTPEPEPEPMPEPDSLFDDLRAERAKYPTPLERREDAAKILNAVAWKHRDKGWGLSTKPGGNNVPAPQGVTVAYDILHHRPTDTLYDVATDEWTGMRITWSQTIHHGSSDRPWLAPVQPQGQPEPQPQPEPTPQPVPVPQPQPIPLEPIIAALREAVLAEMGDLRREVTGLKAEMNRMNGMFEELPLDPPEYTGRILGQSFTLRPKV